MKKIIRTTLLGALITLLPQAATAATNISVETKVTGIYAFGADTSSQNDIWIKVATPATGCAGGFWVSKADKLANSNIQGLLLSAFHTNAKLYVAAYSDVLWPGNTVATCKIHTLGLVK